MNIFMFVPNNMRATVVVKLLEYIGDIIEVQCVCVQYTCMYQEKSDSPLWNIAQTNEKNYARSKKICKFEHIFIDTCMFIHKYTKKHTCTYEYKSNITTLFMCYQEHHSHDACWFVNMKIQISTYLNKSMHMTYIHHNSHVRKHNSGHCKNRLYRNTCKYSHTNKNQNMKMNICVHKYVYSYMYI